MSKEIPEKNNLEKKYDIRLNREEFKKALEKFSKSEFAIELLLGDFDHHNFMVYKNYDFLKNVDLLTKSWNESKSYDMVYPLYDKKTNLFFLVNYNRHSILLNLLYAFHRYSDLDREKFEDLLKRGVFWKHEDDFIKEKMGWFISGEDLTLFVSGLYRGKKDEEEFFENYKNIYTLN